MAFCEKCGNKCNDGANFCTSCGAPLPKGSFGEHHSAGQNTSAGQGFHEAFEKVVNTKDNSAQFSAEEIQSGKGLSILAYLGILVLIPLLAEKNNRFVRYHANQGLLLLIGEVIYFTGMGILSAILLVISWRLYFIIKIIRIVGFVFLAFSILGIVNAANGQAKELPLIGCIRILKI